MSEKSAANIKMEVADDASFFPSSTAITNALANFINMEDIFCTNNMILLVVSLTVLFVVGMKMKLISCEGDGFLCRTIEKVPFLKGLMPAKKQVNFEPEEEGDDDEEEEYESK